MMEYRTECNTSTQMRSSGGRTMNERRTQREDARDQEVTKIMNVGGGVDQ